MIWVELKTMYFKWKNTFHSRHESPSFQTKSRTSWRSYSYNKLERQQCHSGRSQPKSWSTTLGESYGFCVGCRWRRQNDRFRAKNDWIGHREYKATLMIVSCHHVRFLIGQRWVQRCKCSSKWWQIRPNSSKWDWNWRKWIQVLKNEVLIIMSLV